METASKHTHIVIFPFMAQGHTLPLLDLSKALSTMNIKVTIITTPFNSISISKYISNYSNISIILLPFPPYEGLPEGCENTSQLPSMDFFVHFVLATKQLKNSFDQVLRDMYESNDLPLCLISDFFLGWTLDSCRDFGVPRLVSHGMGVLSMAITKAIFGNTKLLNSVPDDVPLDIPEIQLPFSLTVDELHDDYKIPFDSDNPYSNFIMEMGAADANSWGVIVNSFLELEKSHVSSFEKFYPNGAKAWFLGPLFMHNDASGGKQVEQQGQAITKWLDEQVTPASILYVAFGTQADISNAELDEVAFGLEESGVPFLLTVRFDSWEIPQGMEERLKGRGMIVREWVDQRGILGHRATRGFFSHCGWNSTLESISAGKPILAWPMMAEQLLNAKFLVEGLGAGIALKTSKLDIRVSREDVCKGVRELMSQEKGRNAGERSQALAREARRAVQEGGSSHSTLSKLINELRACSTQSI